MSKKSITIIVLSCLLVVSNMFTFVLTSHLLGFRMNTAITSINSFPTHRHDDDLITFYETFNTLVNNYLGDVDKEELIEAAIKGMIATLDDPQTSFFDSRHMEDMMVQTMGSFGGIGVEVTSEGEYVKVITPIKGTPGEKAGLLPEDKIIEVDGENVVGYSLEDAVRLIRGPEGKAVKLKISRQGTEGYLEYEIIRGNIKLDTVFSEIIEENVGLIEITNFDDDTGAEFKRELAKLEETNLSGLIIDMRNNPGGLLNEAIKVAQEVVPKGPITHVVDADGEIVETYYSKQEAKKYPIVVIVNAFSASGSEIVAGALQDSEGAVLVGTKTFGKATVQNLKTLSNNSGLRYTTAKYLTPKKRNIHNEGLMPDYIVDQGFLFPFHSHIIDRELKLEDEGNDVLFLQEYLRQLGYGDIEISGVFDEATKSTLTKYQKNNDLRETGVLDSATREMIFGSIDDEPSSKDVQLEKAIELIKEKSLIVNT